MIVVALIVSWGDVLAQQDPLYTQYMDNLLVINPGFAGSKETGSFMLVARNQWLSIDGAPKTRSFSYNTRVNDSKVGLGFSVLSDKIGPLKQTGFYFDYSYFLKLGINYKLGMGLKGGFSFYRASLTDLQTISPDPIYSKDIFKNFNYVSKEKIHIYLVAGKKIRLGENIHLKTYSMLRLVKNAPASLDASALIGLKEKFWVGGMFRFGDSFGILTQFNVSEKMTIGYSYDFTFSELNAFSGGTHEIMFGYDLNIFNKN